MAGERKRHPNSVVRLRGRRGWSLAQLAQVSRIDAQTLSALETGKLTLHSGHMHRLSTVFACTAEELCTPCISPRSPQIKRRHSRANLRKGRGDARWAGKLAIPKHAPPLVREFFQLLNDNKLLIKDAVDGTDVSRVTVSDWRYRHAPLLGNFEAVLHNLGYELRIVERDEE